ncbi:MAG: nicotinic acid mononucleotide adenylyltransferase, partial [Rhodobacteraceae bacterium]|nr:nicotinic acid mononucleotide adenylyltransferase [Paracoccaceae bacterium]
FVWLMGADNLAGFHTWDRWPEIMARVPVAVLARPGQRMRALHSPAAQRFRRERVRTREAETLGMTDPPAWLYLDMPMRHESSTALRQARRIAP